MYTRFPTLSELFKKATLSTPKETGGQKPPPFLETEWYPLKYCLEVPMAWLRITAYLVNSFSLVVDETLGCLHGHLSSFLPHTPPTSPCHPGPHSSSALCCLNVPCILYVHSGECSPHTPCTLRGRYMGKHKGIGSWCNSHQVQEWERCKRKILRSEA